MLIQWLRVRNFKLYSSSYREPVKGDQKMSYMWPLLMIKDQTHHHILNHLQWSHNIKIVLQYSSSEIIRACTRRVVIVLKLLFYL